MKGIIAVVTVGGSARAADAFVASRHKTMAAAKKAATRLRDRMVENALEAGIHCVADVAAEYADDFVDAGGRIDGEYVRRAPAYTPEELAQMGASS